MLSIIISICASIVSGMMLFFLQRYFKKKERTEEQAEERQRTKDVLMLKSIKAIGELTVANAIAVMEGKTNGEMHKALDDFEIVDKELYDFLIQNSVK